MTLTTMRFELSLMTINSSLIVVNVMKNVRLIQPTDTIPTKLELAATDAIQRFAFGGIVVHPGAGRADPISLACYVRCRTVRHVDCSYSCRKTTPFRDVRIHYQPAPSVTD